MSLWKHVRLSDGMDNEATIPAASKRSSHHLEAPDLAEGSLHVLL